MLFVQELEKLGLECNCAADGNAAVSQFTKSRDYQLVLMDVKISGIDGYEVTKQIRNFERAQQLYRVPIIAITGYADRDACLAVGMDDYWQKPVMSEHFKAIIEKWLPKNQSQ